LGEGGGKGFHEAIITLRRWPFPEVTFSSKKGKEEEIHRKKGLDMGKRWGNGSTCPFEDRSPLVLLVNG